MTRPDLSEAMHAALGYEFGNRVTELAMEQASAVQLIAAFAVQVAGQLDDFEHETREAMEHVATCLRGLKDALGDLDAYTGDEGRSVAGRLESLDRVVTSLCNLHP